MNQKQKKPPQQSSSSSSFPPSSSSFSPSTFSSSSSFPLSHRNVIHNTNRIKTKTPLSDSINTPSSKTSSQNNILSSSSTRSSSSHSASSTPSSSAGSYSRNDRNDRNDFAHRARMMYVNDQIKAPSIMIIDDEKRNMGTFPRRRALEMADETGLDLVQISYDPEKMLSTVRLTDYGKYMYHKGKEEKEKKKQQKGRDMKEIKISYGIGENDLALKIKKAEEFLKEGDSVKVSIRLKGRERMYAAKALEKIVAFKNALLTFGRSQYETPKKEAQGYSVILFAK
jgi:translation initiation factor IF-3